MPIIIIIIIFILAASLNNTQTLVNQWFGVSLLSYHLSGPSQKAEVCFIRFKRSHLWLWLVDFDPFCFFPFIRFIGHSCNIMIDSSQKGNRQWGVWLSPGWEMNEVENVFLTHSWESEYKCLGGFRSRGLYKVQFLFCHPPLPDMPHPPTHEVFAWFCLAWLPAVCENLNFRVCLILKGTVSQRGAKENVTIQMSKIY